MHRCRQGSSLFGVILVGCAESILLALKPTQHAKPSGSVQMRPLVLTAGTVRNFPAQAHGSEMLRMALSFAVEAGVEVCAPLHDAFLIQAPLSDMGDAVDTMRRAM